MVRHKGPPDVEGEAGIGIALAIAKENNGPLVISGVYIHALVRAWGRKKTLVIVIVVH